MTRGDNLTKQRSRTSGGDDDAPAQLRSLLIGRFALLVGWGGAEPLKIPFIATMSGPAAQLGIDSVDGFKFAIKEGKLGGFPVELIVMDDELKPELGVGLAKRAVDREKAPIVVGTTFSNVLMAIIEPVTKANAILISQNAGPSPLAGARCDPNFFSVAFLNDQIYEPVGAYLQKKGPRKQSFLRPTIRLDRTRLPASSKLSKGRYSTSLHAVGSARFLGRSNADCQPQT